MPAPPTMRGTFPVLYRSSSTGLLRMSGHIGQGVCRATQIADHQHVVFVAQRCRIEAELAQQLITATHFQRRRAGVDFHREEPVDLTYPTAGVVDDVMALERFALRVDETAQYGQRLHYADLPVIDAALVQVIVRARRLNGCRRHVGAIEIEAHGAVLVGRDRDEIAPGTQARTAT